MFNELYEVISILANASQTTSGVPPMPPFTRERFFVPESDLENIN